MPNFFVHWLVAERCIDQTAPVGDDPNDPVRLIQGGAREYKDAVSAFKQTIEDMLKTVYLNDRKGFKAFRKKFKDDSYRSLLDNNLLTPDRTDPVTCFSAYMLGACGPDFWTLPSDPTSVVGVPSMASLHFDLGHYHRSQSQFKVAIKRWGAKKPQGFQESVEKCYFLGMASHIATDLVVHQLVNVSAGGYKFLKKEGVKYMTGPWENEQGGGINIWNTHNKVEHYWDSYMRYRYFGDSGPIFEIRQGINHDNVDWFTPWGFPLVETLQKYFRDPELKGEAKGDILSWLEEEKTKFWIEQCFILPRVACDRVLNGSILPFIYDIVVKKNIPNEGAYPAGAIFKEASDEAVTDQMNDPKLKGTTNEKRKMEFFSSTRNKEANNTSHNYLCYYVCPNLNKVMLYGHDVFFNTTALRSFMTSAAAVGSQFVGDLIVAFKDSDALNIGSIDHFWNLDTGLGIDVLNIKSATEHEVITRLDFVHIAEYMARLGKKDGWVPDRLWYGAYLKEFMIRGTWKNRETKNFKLNPKGDKVTPAFQTHYKEFEDLDSVFEDDDSRYLEFIRLNPEKVVWNNNIIKMNVDDFLAWKKKGPSTDPIPAWTESRKKSENVINKRDYKNRLTLQVKTSIPKYGKDKVVPGTGFYFLTGQSWTDEAFKHQEDKASFWINGPDHDPDKGKHETKELDFVLTDAKDGRFSENTDANLFVFRSNLLLNLEKEDDLKRKKKKDEWNNVVEYKKEGNVNLAYSRNFAIGTGRHNVLYPFKSGGFRPDTDFKYFDNVSPTENVFFSLYIVVNNLATGKMYDSLNKKELSSGDIDRIMKIDCMDFVKIVLFYCMDLKGAAQLDKCYIDGLLANVTTVDA